MEQFSADAYTLIATEKLRIAEEDKTIQEALRNGDQEKFVEIMKSILENKKTWGDHIKRYIYDSVGGEALSKKFKWVSEDGVNFEAITEENIREFIKKVFRENGMRNQGSMNPHATTTLGNRLTTWLNSPITSNTISREVCFLFCFGLNMDEKYASYMLEVLRQPTFNPKDYKEVIYYYCICNRTKYADVLEWLEKYDKLEPAQVYEENPQTMALRDHLKMIKESVKESQEVREQQFLDYLAVIKSLPENTKPSETRAKVFEDGVRKFYQVQSKKSCKILDKKHMDVETAPKARTLKQRKRNEALLYNVVFQEEKVNVNGVVDLLESIPTAPIDVPEELREMVTKGIISMPELSYNFFNDRIGENRTTSINREDLLTIAFLYCSSSMKDDEMEAYNYEERRAYFEYEASVCLDECGFGDVYLLNPYELFLVSCLLQKDPLEYFLAVWKELR